MKITKRELRKIIREEKERLNEGADPKRVFYDVIMPALAKAGHTGPEAFQLAKDAVEAAWIDIGNMLYGGDDDRHRGPPSGDYS